MCLRDRGSESQGKADEGVPCTRKPLEPYRSQQGLGEADLGRASCVGWPVLVSRWGFLEEHMSGALVGRERQRKAGFREVVWNGVNL